MDNLVTVLRLVFLWREYLSLAGLLSLLLFLFFFQPVSGGMSSSSSVLTSLVMAQEVFGPLGPLLLLYLLSVPGGPSAWTTPPSFLALWLLLSLTHVEPHPRGK